MSTIVLALLVGCAGDAGSELPPAPTAAVPSVTASPTPTLDPEEAAVIATYQNYLDAFVEANETGNPDHPGLLLYLEGPELEKNQNAIADHVERGWRFTGTLPLVSIEVTALDLSEEGLYTATTTACIDYSDWTLVHKEDGSLVDPDLEMGRYTTSANLWRAPSNDWRIIKTWIDPEPPC